MNIRTAASRIFAGETVTIFADTRNALARDARVEWHSSGGTLVRSDDGATARVRFDAPGTYQVHATPILDGREVKKDSVTIEVKPLR